MLLTAIYFLLGLLVLMAVCYGLLQALTFFGITIVPTIRNLLGVLILLFFLWWFLTTFHLMPSFLGAVVYPGYG